MRGNGSNNLAILLAAAVAIGGAGAAQAQDAVETVVLEGVVTAFTAGAGTGQPTLTLDVGDAVLVDVRLAPYRVLRDLGFVVDVGDDVRIVAMPCEYCEADYAALEVVNLTTNQSFVLRDDAGHPSWARTGWLRVNDEAVVSASIGTESLVASGIVVAFVGGPGEGEPTLTLEVDGEAIDFRVSPFHVWNAAGWIPAAGQELSITYVEVHLADGVVNLAISVYDPVTGVTLYLRDPETVRPANPYRLRRGPAAGEDGDVAPARHRYMFRKFER